MIIPRYIMVLIPILTTWWTHTRGLHKEYWLLAGSVLPVCLALVIYSRFNHTICTWYAGPLAVTGIETIQLPLSIFVTAGIASIPTKRRFVRNIVAILAGEALLVNTWIS